jgi:Ca2+-binding EF-hand superfamily protein
MGCCGSKPPEWAESEARDARERERERRASTADAEVRANSNARVLAWREDAAGGDGDDDDDDFEDPQRVKRDDDDDDTASANARLHDERSGRFASSAQRSAMKLAFRDALANGKFAFTKDIGNAVSCRKLGDHHRAARGNALAPRVFASFSSKNDGGLRLADWVAACVVLHETGSYANKARAGFHAYDVNGDGAVCQTDLVHTLRLILGDGVSERQVFKVRPAFPKSNTPSLCYL